MKTRRPCIVFAGVLSAGLFSVRLLAAAALDRSTGQAESAPVFERLLTEALSTPDDPCAAGPGDDRDLEDRISRSAAQELVNELNAGPELADGSEETRIQDRAQRAVRRLTAASSRINIEWPDSARFRADVLVASPVIALRTRFRARWALQPIGRPALDAHGAPNRAWQVISPEDDSSMPRDAAVLELFAAHRGPSGRPRVLSRTVAGTCAGSSGLMYRLFEWDSRGPGKLTIPISISGAATEEPSSAITDRSTSFPPAGTLRTGGATITLPDRWFSAIDTWDNPSLCAADSYDMSTDVVRFHDRVTNRPDLVPIAQAIMHAQAREYRAVLAYCGSPTIAKDLIENTPPFVFADTLKVTRLGSGTERVEFGFEDEFTVDVERRPSGWTITRVRIAHHQR